MKHFLRLLLFFSCLTVYSQRTFVITKLPENTPNETEIFMASSLNNWNPKDENYQFKKDGKGNLTLILPKITENFEYKLTQGSWEQAEGDSLGKSRPNRKFDFKQSPKIIRLKIASWQANYPKTSTKSENVKILSEDFKVPQLQTTRRIWIYLPPDYHQSTKKYPVIYMEDGQNLFDNATSFSGEWKVDETLNKIFADTKKSAVVIGIDNGGAERLNEYSAWENKKYGGGKGDLYADFLVNTLKPFVDKNFRTLKDAKNTALIGSSMGGLISYYIGLKYPKSFGKLGIFSPSFWFAPDELRTFTLKNAANATQTKFYFYAGLKESPEMAEDVRKISTLLMSNGVPSSNLKIVFNPYGTHSEPYWAQAFSPAFLWLFCK